MNAREEGLDLTQLLKVLRRRLPVIVLAVVVAAGAAYGFSRLQEEEYRATAGVLMSDQGLTQAVLGTSATGVDPRRLGQTNLELAQSRQVADLAARRLGGTTSGADLAAKVVVAADDNSDILRVTATGGTAQEAARIATAYAGAFVTLQRRSRARQITAARDDLRAQLDEIGNQTDNAQNNDLRRALADRLSVLQTLASVQGGSPRVVDPAPVPDEAVAPKPRRNTLIGAVLGLVLGLGLVALLEQLDRRLRTVDDAEHAYGLPLIGVVPHVRRRRAALGAALPKDAVEAFKTIRASLRYLTGTQDVSSVLVISALPAEGKSFVAWRLAGAEDDERVTLIDADLRRASITRPRRRRNGRNELAGEDVAGLSRYLAGEAEHPGLVPVAGTAHLAVVPAGPEPANPASLLGVDRMAHLVKESAEVNDLVIIDTPPLGSVADALPLLSYDTGVVVVARIGVSRRRAAKRLTDQLDRAGANVLGLVVNDVVATRAEY